MKADELMRRKPKTLPQQIADKYGIDAMRDVWIEELNELAVALAHHKRGKTSTTEVEDEIGDVLFCIDQMFDVGGFDREIVKVKMMVKKKILPNKLDL